MFLESSLIKGTLCRRALARAEFSGMNIMQRRSIPLPSPGSNQFSQKQKNKKQGPQVTQGDRS